MLRTVFLIPALIIFSITCKPATAQTTKLIWADEKSSTGKIQMASTDGNYLTDIIGNQNMPCGLAVDDQSEPPKVYFCERGESKIKRVNLDGTNEEEVITGVDGIRDLELDLLNRKIYWVRDTWDDDAVQRADMDGLNSNIEDLYTSSSTAYGFYGLGLDCANQKVYWTQAYNGCGDKIRRMNFDKTGFEDIIVYPQASLINPWDIDISGNKLYFTDCGVGIDVIFSANLDGSAIDTVIKEVDCQFFSIDTATSKIYWGDNSKIECANLDGTDRHDVATGLGYFIMGIAVAHNVSVTNITSNNVDPDGYALYQNYPNPFNPTTAISYSLKGPLSGQLSAVSDVNLTVYNALGQKVSTLVNEKRVAGTYTVTFNASGLNSGIYYYRLSTGSDVQVRKMILMK